VGSGCNGVVALALRPLVPEADQAVDRAVTTIRERYRAMADDGGCVEGNLYWDYGFTYQLLFGHALEHVTGDDRGLLTADNLRKTPRFVETQLGGDGRYFTFNDTQPWLTGLAVCADFGSRLDRPLLRWMADRTAREAAEDTMPVFTRPQFYALAFRARDRTPAPDAFPGVPTLAYLETLNWGVLRSDGASFKPALVLGVKGRDGSTTHHAQADLSGFVLQAGGESFLIDPGYYQPKAEHHSVPLIGGKGPQARGRALIADAWETGPLRTMTVDATHAYQDAGATRVRRVFVLCGDRMAAVLDDIACDGPVTAQYQCGFPTELIGDGAGATIRGEAGALTVRPHRPGLTLAVEGPVDFGRSWVFAKTGVQWYRVHGEYTADPERPLVTVFVPGESGGVTCERRGSEIRLVMEKDAATAVRFRQTDAGWAVVRVP
jgi:hypothetical protein